MSHLQSKQPLEIESRNPIDPEVFRRQGHMIIDFLADYFKNIEEHPVLSQVEPGYLLDALPRSAPPKPESFESILDDVRKLVVPGLTHWQSPNFFGYYPANTSTAGILGEILCSGFSVVSFSWISSPAATELETVVMEWLGEMLDLPKRFLLSGGGVGVIQASTSEAIISTLAAARDQMLQKLLDVNTAKFVVYCSDQTNCSFHKAAQVTGISPQNVRKIKTAKATQFGMCPISLKQAIAADIEAGLVPLYLCATVGTTATAAIDPIKDLCKVVEEYGMWVHIDAAYAGAARVCPEYRDSFNGIELVNSFSFNAHKWLLIGLECCCVWVKDSTILRRTLLTEGEYLNNKFANSEKVFEYKDFQLSLNRRFRALRLLLVLRSQGIAGLRQHIRGHVNLAMIFEKLVEKDSSFELVCKRNFALVCFRVSPSALRNRVVTRYISNGGASNHGDDIMSINGRHAVKREAISSAIINEVNAKLLDQINATGKAFMTHAVVDGIYAIRIAIGATLVEERHVLMAWKLVQRLAEVILRGFH